MRIESTGPERAPVVVLVHGGGVAGWMWRSQVARLREGHRVLVPELPGHGASAAEPYPGSAEVVAELARRLEGSSAGAPVTVVGFSLGAQLAIGLAATRPDLVARVVVVSALAEPVPLAGLSAGLVRVTAPLARRPWFGRLQARALFIPDELLEDYLRDSAAMTPDTLVAITRANSAFRVPPGWARFPGPALLLAGSAEPRPLVRGMRALHAALPGSELEIVEGAGHGLPLERPDRFSGRLEEWMARHPV